MSPTENRLKLEKQFTMLLKTYEQWQRTLQLSADTYLSTYDDSMRLLDMVKQCYRFIHKIQANYGLEQGLRDDSINYYQTRDSKTFTELKSWILEHIAADITPSHLTGNEWDFQPHQNSFIGMSIIANCDLKKNDLVLQIPRQIMLSAKYVPGRRKELIPLLDCLSDTPILELIACLLYHRLLGVKSCFRVYLDSLPSVYNIPVYWDIDTLKCLIGTQLFFRVITNLRASMCLYWQLVHLCDHFSSELPLLNRVSVTWELFRWALGAVSTRQNCIPMNSQSDVALTLIPGWDMINHEHGNITTRFDMESQRLVHYALRAFNHGDEITMCYGNCSNELRLLHSGFAVHDNPDDALDIDVDIPRDELWKIRELLLVNNGVRVSKRGDVKLSIRTSDAGMITMQAVVISMAKFSTKSELSACMRFLNPAATLEGFLITRDLSHELKIRIVKGIESILSTFNEQHEKVIHKLETLVSQHGPAETCDKTQTSNFHGFLITLQGQTCLVKTCLAMIQESFTKSNVNHRCITMW